MRISGVLPVFGAASGRGRVPYEERACVGESVSYGEPERTLKAVTVSGRRIGFTVEGITVLSDEYADSVDGYRVDAVRDASGIFLLCLMRRRECTVSKNVYRDRYGVTGTSIRYRAEWQVADAVGPDDIHKYHSEVPESFESGYFTERLKMVLSGDSCRELPGASFFLYG